ncbi:tonb-dependent receptor [hydrocarbon metagenome]|uniref:Tonb-dependent receptor n=1 Tax=hydrocarbon metagenome TaxID=938273 RepID=A0A0W8G2Y7_9ZZZZ
MPVNSEEKTEVYGFEVDLQTNLRFLPNPFDGIVLNANFSWIKSETFYPLLVVGPRSPVPPFQAQIIDSSRAGRMPGQSDFIANLSLGYEKGGFSGRISMVYQGNALQTVGSRSELDAFTDEYVRWDISAQYELFNNLHLIANFNNIINQPEQSFLGIERFSTRQEYFGWTADFGIKYKF